MFWKRWRHMVVVTQLVVVLSLVLAAHAMAAEKVKLRYFTWATNASIIIEDWIEPFQKVYPHIEIEYEAVPFAQFHEKLLTYCLAGDPPDIVHISVGYVNEFARRGLLVNLQPYFDRDMNPKDYFLEPMAAMRYPSQTSGDLYGMPFAFVVTPLYYNKTIFDRRGVAYPDLNWEWNDVRAAARKLVEDINGDGTPDTWGYFASYGYSALEPVIHSFGGRILDEEYNVVLDQPEAAEAVKFLVSMVLQDRTAPQSGSFSTLFRQGNVAMGIDLNSNIDVYRQQSFDWDVAVLPKGPVKRVVRAWPDSFAIMSGSKYVEEAWTYIRFVTSQMKMDRYIGDRKIPVYKPLAMSREWLQEDMKPNKQIIIQSVQWGDPLEFRPRWGEWTDLRNAPMSAVWRGQLAPEYGLKQWADGIRAVLASPFQ